MRARFVYVARICVAATSLPASAAAVTRTAIVNGTSDPRRQVRLPHRSGAKNLPLPT
jgi:hypothetical protein